MDKIKATINKWDKYSILAAVFAASLLAGERIVFPHFSQLTFLRVFILCTTVYFAYKTYQKNGLKLDFPRPVRLFLLFMALWGVYGGFQVLFYKNLSKSKSLMDVAYIFLIAGLLFTAVQILKSPKYLHVVFKVLRVFAVAFILIGLWEIASGRHLWISRFSDPVFNEKNPIMNYNVATGLFYNENDFSFVLALLAPVFFEWESSSRRNTVFNYVCLALMFLIICINDSFISTVALFCALLCFFILKRGSIIRPAATIAGAALLQKFVADNLKNGLMNLYNSLYAAFPNFLLHPAPIKEPTIVKSSPAQAIQAQIASMGHQGSLQLRLGLIKDGFVMLLHSFLFGVGPGAFEDNVRLLEANPLVVNPHCWPMEILAQYGIFIFAGYFFLYGLVMLHVFRLYKKHRTMEIGIALCLLVFLLPAGFASSSMLKFPAQWLVLSVALSVICIYNGKETAGEAA